MESVTVFDESFVIISVALNHALNLAVLDVFSRSTLLALPLHSAGWGDKK